MRSSKELLAEHQKGLATAARKAIKEAEKTYRAAHPEAGAVRLKAEVFSYPKRPKGFSSHPAVVVGWFVTARDALRETNAATVARLQAKYEPYKVPTAILTRPLPAKALESIAKILAENEKSVDLKANNTLSKIKRALQGKETAEEAGIYDVQFAFGPGVVVVGGIEYPVQTTEAGYRRIRVAVGDKRSWVRCDILEALVKRAT
jgi:hypothetical protein